MKQLFFLLLALACAPIAYAQTDYKLTFDPKVKEPRNSDLVGAVESFNGELLYKLKAGHRQYYGLTTEDGKKQIKQVDLINNNLNKVYSIRTMTINTAELSTENFTLETLMEFKTVSYVVTLTADIYLYEIGLIMDKDIEKDIDSEMFFCDTAEDAQRVIDFLKK